MTDRLLDRADEAPPTPPRRSFVESAANRRRAGRVMQVIACAGVVISLAGAIVGWRLVGRVDDTVGESLTVTGETLITLEETITLADNVFAGVDDALVSTESGLRAAADATDGAAGVVRSIDGLVETVGPSMSDAESTLRDLARIGSTIDTVLEQIDNVPFGPNYDPERPLGEQLERLADDLAPIASALDDTTGDLTAFADSTGELDGAVERLADDVASVNADLDESDRLLDDYLTNAQRARSIATAAEADLAADVAATRTLVVLGGVILALGQIVPWWVGRELTARSAETG